MSERPVTTRFRLRLGERVFPLEPGEHVAGRGEGCEIIVDDRSASRRHARFVVGDVVEVEDLGSVNGVTVNQVAIAKKTRVVHGDRVGIASQILVLVDTEQKGSQTRPGRTLSSPIPARPQVQLDSLDEAMRRGDWAGAERIAAVAVEHAQAWALGTPEVARLERGLLSLGDRDPTWLDRILEMRGQLGTVPEATTVSRLHELARAGKAVREPALRAYLETMAPRVEALPTASRFVYRRLEALLRAKADV